MEEDNKLVSRPQAAVVLRKKETEEWVAYDIGAVAKTLHNGMERILEKEISPASLNAAANAAQQITNIIRLHIEAKRVKHKMDKMGV